MYDPQQLQGLHERGGPPSAKRMLVAGEQIVGRAFGHPLSTNHGNIEGRFMLHFTNSDSVPGRAKSRRSFRRWKTCLNKET